MNNFSEDLFDVFEETEDIIEVIPPPVKQKESNAPLNEK